MWIPLSDDLLARLSGGNGLGLYSAKHNAIVRILHSNTGEILVEMPMCLIKHHALEVYRRAKYSAKHSCLRH
jgi:hypothetical protein